MRGWTAIIVLGICGAAVGHQFIGKAKNQLDMPALKPEITKNQTHREKIVEKSLSGSLYIEPDDTKAIPPALSTKLFHTHSPIASGLKKQKEVSHDYIESSDLNEKTLNKTKPRTVRPKIAIIIDDLGINKKLTARAIELKAPLTMSFIAYANDIKQQAASAKRYGHEIMLHIPMEPESKFVDPGPNALLSGLPEDELLVMLRWNLGQLSDYVGINNHMGSKFTSDIDSMRILMGELKSKSLIFLDSLTTNKSMGRIVAKEFGVPFAARNIFLDHKDSLNAIMNQLAAAQKIAISQGYVIAIGHPRANTLRALSKWLLSRNLNDFELVSASKIARK